MKVTKKITIHLDDPRRVPPVDVMQGDAYTRQLEFSLYSGGEAWNVPDGVSVAVAYHGASGQGAYDTLQDDATKAYTVAGNVVTVVLIPQVAAVAGNTMVTVVFTDGNGKQLATFGVVIDVKRNPAIGSGKPEFYYNLREWIGAGTYYIRINGDVGNELDSGEDYESILKECESGRAVAVLLEKDYDSMTLPLAKVSSGGLYFSSVCDGKEWQVIITRNPEDGSADVAVKTLSAADSPEMYFQITDDGMVSLKPEYRGHCSKAEYPYGVSDNGVKVNGSKNNELPEHIVIPEIVNEIAVTSLAPAMFGYNDAVKSVTVPACITEIPAYFCFYARNLENVDGTENVKVICDKAFTQSMIRKANFPSLERFEGDSQFRYCVMLTVADLGKVTEIPYQAFIYCEYLSVLRNAENVTTVGEKAFYFARRLMAPKFLPALKDIGKNAFSASRVVYDWASLEGCTFGERATSFQYNPVDYWTGRNYTPCKHEMRSVFSQRNPEWANDKIGNTERTYGDGCIIVSCAMVYSALAGVDMSSPKEFVEAAEAINPALKDKDTGYGPNAKQYLEAMGCTVQYMNYSAENLQLLYDALANGAMAVSNSDTGSSDAGHVVAVQGINEKGELLVVDPDSYAHMFKKYRVLTYPMHIQNLSDPSGGFMIVTKP